jgi:hypothetical protein
MKTMPATTQKNSTMETTIAAAYWLALCFVGVPIEDAEEEAELVFVDDGDEEEELELGAAMVEFNIWQYCTFPSPDPVLEQVNPSGQHRSPH